MKTLSLKNVYSLLKKLETFDLDNLDEKSLKELRSTADNLHATAGGIVNRTNEALTVDDAHRIGSVQKLWAKYAITKGYDPTMKVSYHEHLDAFEAGGVKLGHTLIEAESFLTKATERGGVC